MNITGKSAYLKMYTKIQYKKLNTFSTETEDENAMYSICNYVADNDEAINLVEGEKVYVIGRHSSEWWFVKKNITEEEGWVPAQYLMEPAEYTKYVEKKLHEKIDKLPVFERKFKVLLYLMKF